VAGDTDRHLIRALEVRAEVLALHTDPRRLWP
jgi:hypothetical protein